MVEALQVRDDNRLVAFTYGRGVFETSLAPCGLVDAPVTGAPAGLPLAAGPSPARGEVTVSASLPRAGKVRLSVLDASGRHVVLLENRHHDAGTLVLRWNGRSRAGSRVAPGVYFIRLETGEGAVTRKIVRLD